MHFHLPKPLHSWREFAGEVGIIVIGVLIALGAEQVVETIHWRIEVQHAREALYSDASDNIRAVAFRQGQQGCVDRRLQEISSILHARSERRPVKLLGPIGRPVYNAGPQTAWQVSVASDSLAHMSLEEKLDFGGAFTNYANFDQILRSEQDAWLKLSALDDAELLSEEDWANLRQAYSQARGINERLKIVIPYVLTLNLGQRPSLGQLPENAKAAVKQFCTPLLDANAVDRRRTS